MSSAGSPSSPAPASRPRTASAACARCSRRRRSARPWWRRPAAGRCSMPNATTTSKRLRACCSSATAWCSACCCSANRICRHGASWCASIRRLEARGEIRGGRFVTGFGGEQFAAPDAVGRLRAVRKTEKIGELVVLSAADPLNLVGILTPEARVAAIYRSRILLQDGLPIAAVEGGQVRRLRRLRTGRCKTENAAGAALAAPPAAAASAHADAARDPAPGYCARAAEDVRRVATPQVADRPARRRRCPGRASTASRRRALRADAAALVEAADGARAGVVDGVGGARRRRAGLPLFCA